MVCSQGGGTANLGVWMDSVNERNVGGITTNCPRPPTSPAIVSRGQRVNGVGTVRFYGETAFEAGPWVGVELDYGMFWILGAHAFNRLARWLDSMFSPLTPCHPPPLLLPLFTSLFQAAVSTTVPWRASLTLSAVLDTASSCAPRVSLPRLFHRSTTAMR